MQCASDEEAIKKAEKLKSGSKDYPVHYSVSNTSGEKPYEEFFTESETVDSDRFMSLGVITDKDIPDRQKLHELLDKFEIAFSKVDTTKDDVVGIVKSYLPYFEHIEKGKSLDSKM